LRFPAEQLLSSHWFPLLFAGTWLGSSALISLIGGWHSLAETYPAPGDFVLAAADRFRFKSIQLREHTLLPAKYGSCVTVGVTARGLYLAPMFLFRFMHAPILIPWAEITDWDEGGMLWFKWVAVETRSGGPRIRLPSGIGDVARTQWRDARSAGPAA
jgi:hypothetical protein